MVQYQHKFVLFTKLFRMPKAPLQDVIVKPQRRERRAEPESTPSTRTAPVHDLRQQHREESRPVVTDESHFYRPERDDVRGGATFGARTVQNRFPWLLVALAIGAIIVISSFVLSLLFAGASVTVYPKQETVAVNTEFTASQASESLPFERMEIERTQTATLVATSEQQVEERASGVITIFNEYADTPQRLIKNTRFQSPTGRIYRIRSSVEVPGMKSDATPGTIDVEVFAEEPGESYNTEPVEFTIPGFEGLPQEGKVYARGTEDITGGFAGVRRTLDNAEREQALAQMETTLRDELLAAAFADTEQPEGYVLYRDAVMFSFETLPDTLTGDEEVTVSVTGTLHGILLPEAQFASNLARVTVPGYDGTPVRVDNPEDLRVSVKVAPSEDEEATSTSPWLAQTLTLGISGKARLVWEFDPEQLAVDLAGKEKEAMYATGNQGVLSAYPGIDRAEASIRPFWKGAFPEEPENIAIETVLDS